MVATKKAITFISTRMQKKAICFVEYLYYIPHPEKVKLFFHKTVKRQGLVLTWSLAALTLSILDSRAMWAVPRSDRRRRRSRRESVAAIR